MIEVGALSKRYGNFTAVKELSFTVRPGEVLGLVGPNGAGKTSTLRCLAGIIPASSGTVRIAGHDIAADRSEEHTSESSHLRLSRMPSSA